MSLELYCIIPYFYVEPIWLYTQSPHLYVIYIYIKAFSLAVMIFQIEKGNMIADIWYLLL